MSIYKYMYNERKPLKIIKFTWQFENNDENTKKKLIIMIINKQNIKKWYNQIKNQHLHTRK